MHKKVKFVNCTAHDLYDIDSGVTYKAGKTVARAHYKKEVVAESEEGSEIAIFTYDKPIGLPEPEEGVVCIVSSVVLNAVQYYCNNDGVMFPKCCAPHNTQYNKRREIIGCKGFRFNG
jgi:hypothetical protein